MLHRSQATVLLGEALRAARARRGLTQAQVGREVRLHETYVGAVERGERNVTIASLRRIAAALDVSPADLLAESERLERERRGRDAPARAGQPEAV